MDFWLLVGMGILCFGAAGWLLWRDLSSTPDEWWRL